MIDFVLDSDNEAITVLSGMLQFDIREEDDLIMAIYSGCLISQAMLQAEARRRCYMRYVSIYEGEICHVGALKTTSESQSVC